MKRILIKCSKQGKEKYKMYSSCNKGAPGSEMKLNPVFRDKHINGVVISEQGPTPLNLLFLFAVEQVIVMSC